MTIRRLTIDILILYALLTLYTLIGPSLGLPYHTFFTPLLTLIAFTFALLHGSQNLGWKHTLLLLGLTFAISLLFESIGVATGLVFGAYHYTDKLGFKFLGLVPLLIPVAWFMMTYPSLVISRMLTPPIKNVFAWRLLAAGLGAVIMTAWDLAIDPMMVAGGHWVWDQPGAYFGIPLHNYWGWWLTSFITFFLFLSIARLNPDPAASADPYNHLAIWSYAISGLGSLLADFEFSLPGPALVGIFAMLPWVLVGWLRRKPAV